MKLILHHLAKDIRAQRWLLLLSFLVIALRISIDLIENQADYELASVAEIIRSSMVLPVIGYGLWVIMLVRLIQSEPVTGDASFWLTRPVPRGVYLSSKSLFLLFFLVLPYLIPTPLDMLHFGAEPALIWIGVRNDLLLDAYLVIVILWLATYTRTMSQFFIALVRVSLAAIVISWGILDFRISFHDFDFGLQSPLAVFVVTSFVGLLVSLLIEHAQRTSRAGLKVGVSLIAVAVTATLLWPSKWPGTWTSEMIERDGGGTLWNLSNFSTDDGFPIKARFSDDWQQHFKWKRNSTMDEWIATAPLSTIDVAILPTYEEVSATFETGEGGRETLPQSVLSYGAQYDYSRAIASNFPGIQFPDAPVDLANKPLSLFDLYGPVADRIMGKSGTLTLNLYGHMDSLVLEAAIPLNGQAISRQPGKIIRVVRIPGPPRFMSFRKDESAMLAVWVLGYSKEKSIRPSTRYYFLVDPQERTGKFLGISSGFRPNNDFSLLFSKHSRQEDLDINGDDPVHRMTLYIYKLKKGPEFSATLVDPNFSMTPGP